MCIGSDLQIQLCVTLCYYCLLMTAGKLTLLAISLAPLAIYLKKLRCKSKLLGGTSFPRPIFQAPAWVAMMTVKQAVIGVILQKH